MQQRPENELIKPICSVDLESKLNALSTLTTTLWSNPLIRGNEVLLGLQLLKEALFQLRGVSTKENWQQLYEKGVRILEVILRAVTLIPVGVQLSLEVRLRVCDLGEVLCCDYRSCGDRELLMKVVGMYSTRSLLEVIMDQYLPLRHQQVSKIYLNLINVLEATYGVGSGEEITMSSITPINSATLISHLVYEQNSKEVEATIRLFFIGWFYGYRDLPGLSTSSQVEKLLDESGSYKLLTAFPELGIRVALVYIYNEVEAGSQDRFKPLTNFKAMQLLKVYLSSHDITYPVEPNLSGWTPSRGDAFVLRNTSWVLPWLWHHREVDEELVIAITVMWLLHVYEVNLPQLNQPCLLIMNNTTPLLKIFTNLFYTTFLHEPWSLTSMDSVGYNTIDYAHKLLRAVLLIISSDPEFYLDQKLLVVIINCFLASVEQEWIDAPSWSTLNVILSQVPRHKLVKATHEVEKERQLVLIQQIILRELERIINKCGSVNGLFYTEQEISCHLDTLTALIHFTTYMVAADKGVRKAITELHFSSTLLRYVMWDVDKSILHSCQPEFLWKYAASIGALTELLALIGKDLAGESRLRYSVIKKDSENHKRMVFDIVNRLLRGDIEICYVLAPLCSLVNSLPKATCSSFRVFTGLKVMQMVRSLILDDDTHKWCLILPLLIHTVQNLLQSLDCLARACLVENPWNSKLVHKCLTLVLEQRVTCTLSASRVPFGAQYVHNLICTRRVDYSLLRLVVLLLSQNPRWKRDIVSHDQPVSTPSIFQMPTYKSRRIDSTLPLCQLTLIVESYLAKGKVVSRGDRNGNQELTSAELLVTVIELITEKNSMCKELIGQIQQAKKHNGQIETLSTEMCPFYGIHRPIEGVATCLIPLMGPQE